MSEAAIGIDFGTTNSSVARLLGSGEVQLASFSHGQPSFRSLLYLQRSARGVLSSSGPEAIERYLRAHEEGEQPGRLVQSLKSYLPIRSLTGTEIFGRHYTLEDLIARMLVDLRRAAEDAFGQAIRTATVGRPVQFAGAAASEDEAFALERLGRAFQQAGFEQVRFEMEPLAAAWSLQDQVRERQTVLVGDFGGGTSDFSVVRMGVDGGREVLGTAGLPFAGDAFDARIVRKLIAPALGSESLVRSLGGTLPALPAWIYRNLERWHTLSFLRTRNVLEMLSAAEKRALEPEKIAALRALVEQDLGYQLHRAVARFKSSLSSRESALFSFGGDGVATLEIQAEVSRKQFEGWIRPELLRIEQTVDGLLARVAVGIDRVFLTGGSSLVPAVRRIFEQRFGAGVIPGEEFTSVAQGLARSAQESTPCCR